MAEHQIQTFLIFHFIICIGWRNMAETKVSEKDERVDKLLEHIDTLEKGKVNVNYYGQKCLLKSQIVKNVNVYVSLIKDVIAHAQARLAKYRERKNELTIGCRLCRANNLTFAARELRLAISQAKDQIKKCKRRINKLESAEKSLLPKLYRVDGKQGNYSYMICDCEFHVQDFSHGNICKQIDVAL